MLSSGSLPMSSAMIASTNVSDSRFSLRAPLQTLGDTDDDLPPPARSRLLRGLCADAAMRRTRPAPSRPLLLDALPGVAGCSVHSIPLSCPIRRTGPGLIEFDNSNCIFEHQWQCFLRIFTKFVAILSTPSETVSTQRRVRLARTTRCASGRAGRADQAASRRRSVSSTLKLWRSAAGTAEASPGNPRAQPLRQGLDPAIRELARAGFLIGVIDIDRRVPDQPIDPAIRDMNRKRVATSFRRNGVISAR